jgi:hypothetical protein
VLSLSIDYCKARRFYIYERLLIRPVGFVTSQMAV